MEANGNAGDDEMGAVEAVSGTTVEANGDVENDGARAADTDAVSETAAEANGATKDDSFARWAATLSRSR